MTITKSMSHRPNNLRMKVFIINCLIQLCRNIVDVSHHLHNYDLLHVKIMINNKALFIYPITKYLKV